MIISRSPQDIAAARATIARGRVKSKYRSVPTVVDGRRFDSLAEARRYRELTRLEDAGVISDLRCQVPIFLTACTTAHRREEIGHYVADFRYQQDGATIHEDVKGFDTPLSAWKRKHVKAEHGIDVQIVRMR